MANGALSATQIQTYTDARASVFKAAYAALGIGAAGESGTIVAAEKAAANKILGDGSTLYGVGHATLQALAKDPMQIAKSRKRYDVLFSYEAYLMSVLDDIVKANLPAGWVFSGTHAFDSFLLRMNAANANAPATPAAAGTLTAAANVNGALPLSTSGNAPYLVHTLIGTKSNYESLPSAVATRVAITGVNNAYSYQVAGNVPAGVYGMKVYRSYFGGASGPYWLDPNAAATVTLIPGSPYPAVLILTGDSQLRTDWTPPSWMSAALTPEAAALFALATAVASGAGSADLPMVYNANGMLSPENVLLGPATGFIGIGNAQQSGILASSVFTGSATTTLSAGAFQTTNNPTNDVQGFAGAMGLRCRVTTALNGSATPTITYGYYAAATGWGNLQTSGSLAAGSAFATGLVGDFVTFTIPAGRVIRSIASESVSGTASAGAWSYEGVFPRSY